MDATLRPGEAETLVTDVKLELRMQMPGPLLSLPGVKEGGNEVLNGILSSLEQGSQKRAQQAYDEWVKKQRATSV